MQLLIKKTKDKDLLSFDQLTEFWMTLDPSSLKTEIEATLWRNEIEESTFRLTFYEKINKKFAMKIAYPEFY